MSKNCLDLFAGLGGFSAAFENHPSWNTTTVDFEPTFNPDIEADILNLTHNDFSKSYDLILASPPCKAFSMASGKHLNQDGEPTTNYGAKSILLVHHTVGLIKSLNPDYWFLENPMGGLRQHLGKPDAHIWFCQYGSPRAKPTDLWGDIPEWFNPKKCSKGNQKCHHEKAPRGSTTGTQSTDLSPAERSKIPYELSESIRYTIDNPYPNSLL